MVGLRLGALDDLHRNVRLLGTPKRVRCPAPARCGGLRCRVGLCLGTLDDLYRSARPPCSHERCAARLLRAAAAVLITQTRVGCPACRHLQHARSLYAASG